MSLKRVTLDRVPVVECQVCGLHIRSRECYGDYENPKFIFLHVCQANLTLDQLDELPGLGPRPTLKIPHTQVDP